MDDIAACIKDHQYNEAIRKTTVDPETALAKAILERIPAPPKNGKHLPPVEEFMKDMTLEKMMETSLGRYFLCEAILEKNDEIKEKHLKTLQEWLDMFYDFQRAKSSSKSIADGLLNSFDTLAKQCHFDFSESVAQVKAEMAHLSCQTDKVGNLARVFDCIIQALKSKFLGTAFEAFKAHEVYPRRYQEVLWYRSRPPSMDDFVVFRDLGRGAFGVVSGARHRVTGQLVALKGMNRKLIKGKNVLKMVKVEFRVLKALGDNPSPFCVALEFSFMDTNDLYFGLPLCTGGDLMYHLRANRKGFGFARAQFFAAEVALGLEHLHNLGILYRDLKPENVLLDENGHAKISDMGLAILTNYTPQNIGNHTFQGRAGTPGYWPPEMIKKEGYGFDADWWSYGVMLYEFLAGVCAFSESHTKCKDRNEATLIWEIKFPSVCSREGEEYPEDAKSLILALLDRNRETRLGAKPDAVDQVKAHPFFNGLDWSQIATGKMPPPWLPPDDSINAASQEEIQERSKEHEFRKLKLTVEDEIEGISYSSNKYEKDLVHVLQLEKEGKLKHLERRSGSVACIIL